MQRWPATVTQVDMRTSQDIARIVDQAWQESRSDHARMAAEIVANVKGS